MSGRVFLHVGAPKTGTTFLQAVLWKHRERLQKAGLLLPGQSLHTHFQAALEVRGTPERAKLPELIEGAWGRLVDAAADWSGDVVVSHELMATAPAEAAAEAVEAWRAQGREVHVVLTARDAARQLPAEWQERVKHRSTTAFEDFIARAQDPATSLYRHLWAAQDYPDILHRWGAGLPPEHLHVVTVPPPGAPRDLLWERFATLLGLVPGDYDLAVPRENSSIGLEQALILRETNRRLGTRLPLPGRYTGVGKGLFAQQVLANRAGTKLVLGGADLVFARQRSAEMAASLRELGVDVRGDLDELLVPERADEPSESTGRRPVSTETLLEESLGATADVLATVGEWVAGWDTERERLRSDLRAARTELRRARGRIDDLEREAALPLGTKVRRAARRRVGGALSRLRSGGSGRRPKIWFLMFNADGLGGLARTSLTVANALAATHEVEILSVYMAEGVTTFPLDPRVKLSYLVPSKPRQGDYQPKDRKLAGQPSVLPGRDNYTALSDRAMTAAFRRMRRGDVLVSTRPSLHVASQLLAPDKDVVRVGWEHLNFIARYSGTGWTGEAIDRAMPGLDAFVVLTDEDAADYRARHPQARVRTIRNAVTWPPVEQPVAERQKVVVAAGRLNPVKGFDMLIEAWALLADEFPDWTCRIYGHGPLQGELQAEIDRTGVRVEMPGYTSDMKAVLSEAGIFALSSRTEGFGMVLVEAMAVGTPLVSFDCPRGPGEIVDDGRNGRLVPAGDVPAFAKALGDLMRDADLREQMGANALQDAHRFSIESVTNDWLALLGELSEAGRG